MERSDIKGSKMGSDNSSMTKAQIDIFVVQMYRWGDEDQSRIIELCGEIEKLMDALEFYADSRNYGEGSGLSWDACEHKYIGKDRGYRARIALNRRGLDKRGGDESI